MPDARVIAARVTPGASVAEWKAALTDISRALGWSVDGQPAFSSVIRATDRVLIKPNWVMHQNKGPWGLDPLITSPALIIAAAELVLECAPAELVLGDAPLQACDVEALWRHGGMAEWAAATIARGAPLRGPLDFRRTIATVHGAVVQQATAQRDIGEYRLVNLGADSLLEPVTTAEHAFRVTQYPPDLMRERHRPGLHEYLIASDVLASTVVLNLPKLKTHKKAGVTAALKNLVGINGNKEFLPHHRVGSPSEGGDCYPRRNPVKRLQERLCDFQNSLSSVRLKQLLRWPISGLGLLGRYHRERFGLEGAWSGNDTVWRMALDLNRVLLYADAEGRMRDEPQRRELHVVDASFAGQGDGPLASEPFALGLLLGADEAPAADFAGARLLGLRPDLIPIVRGAFSRFRYPIGTADAASVSLNWPDGAAVDLRTLPKPTRYPEGWVDCTELQGRTRPVVGTTFSRRRAPGSHTPAVDLATE